MGCLWAPIEKKELRHNMVETNYKIATRFYSYSVLQQKLKNLIYDHLTCNPKNMKKYFCQALRYYPNPARMEPVQKRSEA